MEPKRLYRSNKGIIAGVCGGLGDYFNLDPVLVRAIFVLLFCIGGGGLLLYIILWIVMPRSTNYYEPYQNQNQTNETVSGEENFYQSNNPAMETSSVSSNQIAAFIIGFIFILFGILILMRRFFDISFIKLWPFALIIVGIVLIVSYMKKQPKN